MFQDQGPDRLEAAVRRVAVPLALVLAWGMLSTPTGAFLGRAFLSMWVHETGHAVAAWFCGLPAFPGPWFTPTGEARSWGVALLLGGALGYAGLRAWQAGRRDVLAGVAVLLALQFAGTVLLSRASAQTVVVFFGDGGSLVLGTAALAAFPSAAAGRWRRDGLRWGFLVIGAVAFADAARTWWAAYRDRAAIPLGRVEGGGLSDASRLLEDARWSASGMVRAYLVLAALCLVVLALSWVRGLRTVERDAA